MKNSNRSFVCSLRRLFLFGVMLFFGSADVKASARTVIAIQVILGDSSQAYKLLKTILYNRLESDPLVSMINQGEDHGLFECILSRSRDSGENRYLVYNKTPHTDLCFSVIYADPGWNLLPGISHAANTGISVKMC